MEKSISEMVAWSESIETRRKDIDRGIKSLRVADLAAMRVILAAANGEQIKTHDLDCAEKFLDVVVRGVR